MSPNRANSLSRPLPPFAKRYQQQGCELGPWICCGPGAWDDAKRGSFPRMVLPYGADPADFRWPVRGQIVTVTEHGIDAPELIRGLAHELIWSNGADVVIAQRSVGGLMKFIGVDCEQAA